MPALFNWPGVLMPSKVNSLTKITDLFPTIASIAGAEDLDSLNLDGMNIWPLLTARDNPSDRDLFLRTNLSIAYRKGQWKLIHHAPTLDSAKNELFNIAADPLEQLDLIDAEPEIYQTLWAAITEEVLLEDGINALGVEENYGENN